MESIGRLLIPRQNPLCPQCGATLSRWPLLWWDSCAAWCCAQCGAEVGVDQAWLKAYRKKGTDLVLAFVGACFLALLGFEGLRWVVKSGWGVEYQFQFQRLSPVLNVFGLVFGCSAFLLTLFFLVRTLFAAPLIAPCNMESIRGAKKKLRWRRVGAVNLVVFYLLSLGHVSLPVLGKGMTLVFLGIGSVVTYISLLLED